MRMAARLLQVYFPVFLKKMNLRRLFALTADAFECEAPQTEGLSHGGMIRRYALFTKEQAEKSLACAGDKERRKAALRREAFALGDELRETCRIKDLGEALAFSRVLYRVLAIDFRGTRDREVVVKRCFFSTYYSAEVCDLVSALDEGLIAGLSGGANLRFYRRITDGSGCCRAHLTPVGGDA
jgi:hypothetical protein